MSTVITKKPVFKPEINFQPAYASFEERTTIVHCVMTHTLDILYCMKIRIWPTTFLVQPDGTRKNLLHAYNITEYPEYKHVSRGHVFTLIFEGLDKGCTLFDLFEDIPEPSGFLVKSIRRNSQDVYWIDIE